MANRRGARGGIQILGLAPQAYGSLLASPRRFGGFQVVARVLVLAWVSAFVSLRLPLQASSWLRVSPGVGWAGGLASPCPFLGAVYVVGLLATVRGFRGPQGHHQTPTPKPEVSRGFGP